MAIILSPTVDTTSRIQPLSTTPEFPATLKLYNSSTNKFIQNLTQSTVLPFNSNYTLVYQPNTVNSSHSVEFLINGQVVKVENIAPYSISGDVNGVLSAWTQILKDTPMNISVIEYSGQNRTGTVINTMGIQLIFSTATSPTSVSKPHIDYQLQVSGSLDMSKLNINGNIQFIFNGQ